MEKDAGEFLRQHLLETGQLLVDIVGRRAAVNGFTSQLMGGLFKHLVHREPIFHAGVHDIYVIGFARLAAKLWRLVRCFDGGS